jgi:DNA processing protein
MPNTNQLLYEVAIGMIPGVGPQLTKMLISYCGSPEGVFKEKKGKLLKIPGIGQTTAEAILNQNVLGMAEKEIVLARNLGIQLIFYTSKTYPERLKNIPDAPSLLYYQGNADLNSKKVLSIVGTRNATAYGKDMIEQLVQDFSSHRDLLIISGLAYGIDVYAHKAALNYRVPTVGVMASGINIIYPSLHRDIARKMTETGGIISEYRIYSKPEPARFPARNRIIAGLSDAVLVVEAAQKGGALITAELSNEYNRQVFAIPGNVGMKYSAGCNALIRDNKAHMVTSCADLEYFMNWDALQTKHAQSEQKDFSHLEGEAKEVIAFLEAQESILLDELSWKSQIPLARLASLLLNLEFDGIVKSLPGKKYKLIQ